MDLNKLQIGENKTNIFPFFQRYEQSKYAIKDISSHEKLTLVPQKQPRMREIIQQKGNYIMTTKQIQSWMLAWMLGNIRYDKK